MSKRNAIGAVLFLALAACLVGCNTVKGAGQDLQEASDNTAKAIDKAFDGD